MCFSWQLSMQDHTGDAWALMPATVCQGILFPISKELRAMRKPKGTTKPIPNPNLGVCPGTLQTDSASIWIQSGEEIT